MVTTSHQQTSGENVLGISIATSALEAAEGTFNALASAGRVKRSGPSMTIGYRLAIRGGLFRYEPVLRRSFGDSAELNETTAREALAMANLTARAGMPSAVVIASHPELIESEEEALHGGFTVIGGGIVAACSGLGNRWNEYFACVAYTTAIAIIGADIDHMRERAIDVRTLSTVGA